MIIFTNYISLIYKSAKLDSFKYCYVSLTIRLNIGDLFTPLNDRTVLFQTVQFIYICLLIDIVPFLVLRHLCLLGFFDCFWRLFSLMHVCLSPLKFPRFIYCSLFFLNKGKKFLHSTNWIILSFIINVTYMF